MHAFRAHCIRTGVAVTVAALVVATRVATGITALVARGRKAAAAFVTAAVAAFVTSSFVAASGKGATGLEGMRRAIEATSMWTPVLAT